MKSLANHPLDIAQRLAQWRQEATDPTHPNYYHADLDQPVSIYATISQLLQKLSASPDEFGHDDVVALFGALNSGPRMKNKVADENPLPALRETLFTLVNGPGMPTDKIVAANRAIKFASHNMLGELYGWANAETAPLYNGCAIAALHHLGYAFNDKDYTAFVAAHEQFKQIYLQQVGRLRPELPLNLEIDKLYNVIDKVDLKQKVTQHALAKPFSDMFASWEEAESAFDLLAKAAYRLGLAGPDDPLAAFTLRRTQRQYRIRLSYGPWLVLGVAGIGGQAVEVEMALLRDRMDVPYTSVGDFQQGEGEQPISLYTIPWTAVGSFGVQSMRSMPKPWTLSSNCLGTGGDRTSRSTVRSRSLKPFLTPKLAPACSVRAQTPRPNTSGKSLPATMRGNGTNAATEASLPLAGRSWDLQPGSCGIRGSPGRDAAESP